MKKVIYLLLLLLSFILIGCTARQKIDINNYDNIQQQAKAIRKETGLQTPKVEILDNIEVSLDNGYVSIDGSVKNVGSVDVENFKVVIDFKDSNDKVLDSGSTYNTSVLKVDSQQKFEITHKWDDKYKNYTIRIEY